MPWEPHNLLVPFALARETNLWIRAVATSLFQSTAVVKMHFHD